MDTLVLNRSYMPIDRITWQDAFVAIFSGRAQVVDEYPDRVVRSASAEFRVPSIIRYLGRVVSFQRSVRFNRNNVYMRDGGKCCYCGLQVSRRVMTFDHITPRRMGGKTTWENIVVACFPCNQKKADRTPEEAKMRLLKRPHRPTMGPALSSNALNQWQDTMPESWRDYLVGYSYWHTNLEP